MQINEVELPNWMNAKDRYFLIEATGVAQIHGYTQRPTAERKARSGGYGLYDRREDRMVIAPDGLRRLQEAERLAESAEVKLDEAQALVSDIKDAIEEENSHA